MNHTITLSTNRLLLSPLSEAHSGLIYKLLNTEGWLTFIGDRHVKSDADAIGYIKVIKINTTTLYWTVSVKNTNTPIGVVTLIKRPHLEHKDIGFAFLPEFAGKGYAYEASHSVLSYLFDNNVVTHILAEILPNNISSIKLVTKLGLQFEKALEMNNEIVHIYKAAKADFPK